MGVLSAPIDEIMGFVDKIQEWLNANRIIDETLKLALEPLMSLNAWVGQFAEQFQSVAKEKLIEKIKPILDVIDVFLGAVNGVIDALQTIVEMLEAFDPTSW